MPKIIVGDVEREMTPQEEAELRQKQIPLPTEAERRDAEVRAALAVVTRNGSRDRATTRATVSLIAAFMAGEFEGMTEEGIWDWYVNRIEHFLRQGWGNPA